MNARNCLLLSSLLGLAAVLLGAFAAHGLADRGYLERRHADLPPKSVAGMTLPAAYKYLHDFQTGVRYHMWHALALLGVSMQMRHGRSKLLNGAAWCFTGGVFLFSGSLYVLVIGGPRWMGIPWGAVTPFGGTLLLIGWLLLALFAVKESTPPAELS